MYLYYCHSNNVAMLLVRSLLLLAVVLASLLELTAGLPHADDNDDDDGDWDDGGFGGRRGGGGGGRVRGRGRRRRKNGRGRGRGRGLDRCRPVRALACG